MTNYCTVHQIEMEEKESKSKFNPDGSPKTYWGHVQDGKLCFGESTSKATTAGRTNFNYPKKAVQPEVNWDAKERVSIAQTASNASAVLLAAKANVLGETITDEAFEHTSDFIYNWILGKRNGE